MAKRDHFYLGRACFAKGGGTGIKGRSSSNNVVN